MTAPDLHLPDADSELANDPKAGIDLEALAEKIIALLLREMELEAERAGKLFKG